MDKIISAIVNTLACIIGFSLGAVCTIALAIVRIAQICIALILTPIVYLIRQMKWIAR
nr:MAG TPA: Phospholipase/Carboxylesterase [Caudoviricetes sp.]